MEKKLTIHSDINDLLRLKKALQFIGEVVRSYEIDLHDHVGLSCVIAISKAEELKSQVSRFCPVYSAFEELAALLKHLCDMRTGSREAQKSIEKISSYFTLDRYELIPKPIAPQKPPA